MISRAGTSLLSPLRTRLAVSLMRSSTEPGKLAALRYWRAELSATGTHSGLIARSVSSARRCTKASASVEVSSCDCGSSRTTSRTPRSIGRDCTRRAVLVDVASVHTISRPEETAGRIWSRMLAACPWCVPLRANCRMSGMYQMSFLEAASSSTVRWMRPSSWPNHCCPAIRSAPPASKTSQPSPSSRLASSRRNVVLPTRWSPLTSSERVGVCRDAVSAADRASRHTSGSTRSSSSLRSAQKRPNEERKPRSMLARWKVSSCLISAVAWAWFTRCRKALIVPGGEAFVACSAEPKAGASPRRSLCAKWSRKNPGMMTFSHHQSLAPAAGAPTGGRGSATVKYLSAKYIGQG